MTASPAPSCAGGGQQGLAAKREERTGPGYNGQLHEPGRCWQFLGNGYRVYNPRLGRFHSPDDSSPFGPGGTNAYAYCAGDPINHADPTGHFLMPIATLLGGGAVALFGASGAVAITGDSKSAKFLAVLGGAFAVAALAALGARALVRRQSSSRLGEVRIHRGKNKDWLDVHGSSNGSLVGDTPMDGTEMTAYLRSKGLGDKPLIYLSCNSGTGPAPQAQVVADGLGQPVIGFVARSQAMRSPTGPWACTTPGCSIPKPDLHGSTRPYAIPR